MAKRVSIGNKLYLSVLSLFFIFALAFIVFQQHRERQYKIETLNLRLQDFNDKLHEALDVADSCLLSQLRNYLDSHHLLLDLRVTVIRKDGTVLFDNVQEDVSAMGNHAQRQEIVQAIATGSGSTVDRNSTTLGREYFYSATYYPDEGYIIRSALPYNVDLAKNLQTEQHYLWLALTVMLLLTVVLYRFIHRLGRNITKLNSFAAQASQTPSTLGEDWETVLSGFSNDELGDTAERIVKLYVTLQRTQREQDVLKRQLTQNVAHELKTPVASIQGYLETIIENPKVDDSTRQIFLERCYSQSKRLTSLLADMSMLNTIDDGAKMMSFETVDVAEQIRTVEKECQFTLEQKKMTMTIDIPGRMPIHGNSSLLYSIFRNLTDNAIAYAGTRTRITLRGRVIYPGQGDGKPSSASHPVYSFVFSDTGVGVDPVHLPRLFERFYRVDKGRSRLMGGTGLGLAIVKNAILLHGGQISVKNREGGGLEFDFTLTGSGVL